LSCEVYSDGSFDINDSSVVVGPGANMLTEVSGATHSSHASHIDSQINNNASVSIDLDPNFFDSPLLVSYYYVRFSFKIHIDTGETSPVCLSRFT
jgi:hypothetical protein